MLRDRARPKPETPGAQGPRERQRAWLRRVDSCSLPRSHFVRATMTSADLTLLLEAAGAGDANARDELAREVYEELRRIARSHVSREHGNHSVQATQLVNDAFVRLVERSEVSWENRRHFYGFASRVMRQLLVDRARARKARKRGGDASPVPFDEARTISLDRDEDVLRVDEALRQLATVDARQAEIVTMRFYGGLGMQEIAEALGISKRAAEREWTLIKAWLRRELAQ